MDDGLGRLPLQHYRCGQQLQFHDAHEQPEPRRGNRRRCIVGWDVPSSADDDGDIRCDGAHPNYDLGYAVEQRLRLGEVREAPTFLVRNYPITAPILTYIPIGNVLKATAIDRTPQQIRRSAPKAYKFFAQFKWGSGGTNVNVFLQTSYDGGASWWDSIYLYPFYKVSANEFYTLARVTGSGTSRQLKNDQSFSPGQVMSCTIGTLFRLLIKTAGTYAGTTLSVDMQTDHSLSLASGFLP